MSPQTVYAYIFVYRSNNIHAVVYAFIIITVQETQKIHYYQRHRDVFDYYT